MKAGPTKGRIARKPRRRPSSASRAAASVRSVAPPRLARTSVAMPGLLHEDVAGEPQGNAQPPALVRDLDRALVLGPGNHHEPHTGTQPAPLELAKPGRVGVRDGADHHLFARLAVAQRSVADAGHLTAEARDGVPVRIQVRPAQQLEDAGLHALRDHVLEAGGLVVDLVPTVAEDLYQEHLQQAVVADQLERRRAPLGRQLLSTVAVVSDQALGR